MAIEAWAETTVVAALLESEAVTDIAGNRVYPLKIPQGTLLPSVVYQRYSSAPNMALLGYTSELVVMLVVAYAKKYGEAKSLALAVRAAMAAEPLKAVIRSDRDIYYEEADAYGVHMEFVCEQTGGYCYG